MRQFCFHIILGSGYFGLPLMSFSKSSFITTSQAICNLFLTESIHLVSSDTLSLSVSWFWTHSSAEFNFRIYWSVTAWSPSRQTWMQNAWLSGGKWLAQKKISRELCGIFWDNSSTYYFINRKKFEFLKMFYYAKIYCHNIDWEWTCLFCMPAGNI